MFDARIIILGYIHIEKHMYIHIQCWEGQGEVIIKVKSWHNVMMLKDHITC